MLQTLLLSFSLALAADPAGTAIEQAQSFAVKKNRQEACVILQKALIEIPANHKSRAKVMDSLNHLSKLFFTDKGQKEFEAGQAMMWDNPDIALTHLKSAQALEDSNILVLNHIARIQMMKQDCEAAIATVESARKINSFASESAILELRALACQQRFVVLREKAKAIVTADKWEEAYILYLTALDSAQQQNWKKAHEALTKVTEEQPQFPEAYYQLAKVSGELEKDNETSIRKYVSLCKALTVRDKRRFSIEPKLCANQKEAEDELLQKAKDN